MEYELKKQIQVFSKDANDYIAAKNIEVSFRGKKGLLRIKKIQDIIFASFKSQGENKQHESQENQEDVTVESLLSMIEVVGISEKVTEEILDCLKDFGKIEGIALNDNIIDELDLDDIDDICKGVLKHFLLPKITQMLNSLSN